MDSLCIFCNATTVNGSIISLIWQHDRILDCGILAITSLLLLPLLLALLLESTVWRKRRRDPVPWQTMLGAGRGVSAAVSGIVMAVGAAMGAYYRDQSSASCSSQLASAIVFLTLGGLISLHPGRRRSLLLAGAWLPALAALILDAVYAWIWEADRERLFRQRLLATLAAGVQIPFALAWSIELIQLASRQSRHSEEAEALLGRSEDGHGCLARLLFTWTHPLLRKGTQGQLESVDSLFQLPEFVEVDAVSSAFSAAREAAAGRRRFLLRCLASSFGAEYLWLGLLKFVANMLSFTGPVILDRLVHFVSDKEAPLRLGLLYAGALFAGSLLSALAGLHFSFRMTRVGLKVRTAIVTAVYDKLLELNSADLNDSGFTQGQLMNFMSTDTDRIVNFCPSFHDAWALPLQLAIALFLLYREVGLAFLAGLLFAIVLVPVNRWITQRIGVLSTKMMLWKDKRVNLMTELLLGIRSVKLCAWEDRFAERLAEVREEELKYLKGRKYLDAACVYLWASAPALIALLTFVTYVEIFGHQLTAPKVFTTISLMGILIGPINAFPWVLNGLMESWVSIKRIQSFLTLHKAPPPLSNLRTGDEKNVVRAENLSLAWEAGRTQPVVSDVSFALPKGSLIGVVGPVGGGKSSLLAGLAGELHAYTGTASLSFTADSLGIAYVTQEPWLEQGSLRENILFGHPFDQTRYRRTIFVCALEPDLKAMPEGDSALVGEGGSRLSGGQKARVALARAVYARLPLYLLDDPLAAVDARVAEHIFRECIEGELLASGASVVLATHHRRFLASAPCVIQLAADGTVVRQGPGADVLDSTELVTTTKSGAEVSSGLDDEGAEPVFDQKEEKETGRVAWDVYVVYAGFIGACLSVAILLSLTAMQANIFLMFVFGVVGTLSMIAVGLPWFIICIVFIAVVYYFIQRYYRSSTCDLKRLSSISLSPIYAQFSETLSGGAPIIRAARQSSRYRQLMRDRVRDNARAAYSTLAASQWLGVRLQGLGVLVVASVALLAVTQRALHMSLDPG